MSTVSIELNLTVKHYRDLIEADQQYFPGGEKASLATSATLCAIILEMQNQNTTPYIPYSIVKTPEDQYCFLYKKSPHERIDRGLLSVVPNGIKLEKELYAPKIFQTVEEILAFFHANPPPRIYKISFNNEKNEREDGILQHSHETIQVALQDGKVFELSHSFKGTIKELEKSSLMTTINQFLINIVNNRYKQQLEQKKLRAAEKLRREHQQYRDQIEAIKKLECFKKMTLIDARKHLENEQIYTWLITPDKEEHKFCISFLDPHNECLHATLFVNQDGSGIKLIESHSKLPQLPKPRSKFLPAVSYISNNLIRDFFTFSAAIDIQSNQARYLASLHNSKNPTKLITATPDAAPSSMTVTTHANTASSQKTETCAPIPPVPLALQFSKGMQTTPAASLNSSSPTSSNVAAAFTGASNAGIESNQGLKLQTK